MYRKKDKKENNGPFHILYPHIPVLLASLIGLQRSRKRFKTRAVLHDTKQTISKDINQSQKNEIIQRCYPAHTNDTPYWYHQSHSVSNHHSPLTSLCSTCVEQQYLNSAEKKHLRKSDFAVIKIIVRSNHCFPIVLNFKFTSRVTTCWDASNLT